MLEKLYIPYDGEVLAFGKNWCGPDKYVFRKETRIAYYKSSDDSDGQTVVVYCTAIPARFYRIVALEDKNSIGEKLKSYELRTGSGEYKLAADIAKAISTGMLTVNVK